MLQILQHRTPIVESNHDRRSTMAFWKRKRKNFEEMVRIIKEQPGIRPSELARRLGVSRSTIQRRLPSLEEAGYLLYEDDEGRLYPYHPQHS